MDLMKSFIEKNMPEKAAPAVNVGDTVRVHLRVKEGNRERIQVFEGTVIAKKHGGIPRDLHRPPHLLRRRRGEGLPPLQPCDREGRDRP